MKKVFFCFLVLPTISLNGAHPGSSPTRSSELLTKDSSPQLNHAIARLRPFSSDPKEPRDSIDYAEAEARAIREGLLVPTTPRPYHEAYNYTALSDTHAPHSAVVGHSQSAPAQDCPQGPIHPALPRQPTVTVNTYKKTHSEKIAKEHCNCCSECWQDASCRCAIGTFAAIGAFFCFGAIWQLTSHQSSCSNPVTSQTDVTNSCWIASGIGCNGNTDLTFEGQPFPGITQGNLLTDYIGDTLTLKGYDQSGLCVQTIDCGNVNCSPNHDQTTETICWSALSTCNAQPHNTTASSSNIRKRLAAKFAAQNKMD